MAKFIDLTGQRFGRWLVVSRGENNKRGLAQWLCKCECDPTIICTILGANLRSGQSRSCGCLKRQGHSRKDLSGQRFGDIEVIRYIRSDNGRTLWLCKCHAGLSGCKNEFELDGGKLKHRHQHSCGCRSRLISSQIHSKGKGVVTQERLKASLTGRQFAAIAGISSSTLSAIENNHRKDYWRRTKGGIRKAAVQGEHVVTDSQTRDDLRYTASEPCGYCRTVVTRRRSVIERQKRRSKSGLIFCAGNCSKYYRWHGPKPIETVPELTLMDAPKPPKERRKRSITTAINEIVQTQKEAGK